MDETSRKSFHAAIWYIVSNFISKALLHLCTPLYTRLLTTAEYGEYSNFLSWQSILVIVFTFDLYASVGIAYYDYDDKKRFDGFINTITVFSYFVPGLFCVVITAFKEFFSDALKIRKEFLVLLMAYIIFNNTLNIFQAEQRVRLKYKLSAVLTLISSIFTVAVTLIFVFHFEDRLYGILLGGIAVNAAVSFVLSVIIWKRSHAVKWEYARYAFVITVPLIPHVLAGTILGSSDKVMITRYCGEEYTAFYSLVYTISMVITMVASSVNKAWTPWFYERLKNNIRDHIKTVSNIIVAFIATGAFFVCLLAPEILYIIGGRSYLTAAPIMPPVIAACLLNCVSTFYINIEFYNKKTAGISIATAVSAVLNVIMNYYFISRFGYMAAAYTTLASSAVTLLFHLYKVNKQGMIDVLDNKFLMTLLCVFLVVSELLIAVYKHTPSRYVLTVAAIAAIISVCLKYKAKIGLVIKNFKGDDEVKSGRSVKMQLKK